MEVPAAEMIVQVAGVIDRREAGMLVEEGVRWLGLPLRLAVHRPDLSEKEAADLVRSLPGGVCAVAITYDHEADAVLDLCDRVGTHFVQLHGPIPERELEALRQAAPDLFVIKSLVVAPGREATLEEELRICAPWVNAFITDTFDPTSGTSGATGKTHDWTVSRRLRELSPKPLILAGGLTPGNVAAAIAAVGPAGIDAHTGLEGPGGRKDREKVRRFLSQAQRAFMDRGNPVGRP